MNALSNFTRYSSFRIRPRELHLFGSALFSLGIHENEKLAVKRSVATMREVVPSNDRALARTIMRLGRKQKWEEALLHFERRRRSDTQIKLQLHSIMLATLARSNRHVEAISHLKGIISEGIKPDAIMYTTVINACERSGAWQDSLDLLKEAKSRNIEPDTLMLASVAMVCCQERVWQECLDTLQEMRERGMGESGESFDDAVEACMNGGPLNMVRDWLKDALRAPKLMKTLEIEERRTKISAARKERKKEFSKKLTATEENIH